MNRLNSLSGRTFAGSRPVPPLVQKLRKAMKADTSCKAYGTNADRIREKALELEEKEALKQAVANTKTGDDFSAQESAQKISKMLAAAVENLRETYPGLQISFSGSKESQDVEQLAMSAKSGMHLVLNSRFLEWMTGGAGTFEEGVKMIEEALSQLKSRALAALMQPDTALVNCGVVIGEDGKATFWTACGLTEKERDPKEEDPREVYEETKRQGLKKLAESTRSKVLPVNLGKEAAMLAQVDTADGVRAIMARVCAHMFTLKSSGGMYDQTAVNRTLAQMERMLGRTASKIKGLEREELMKRMQKRASQQKQQQKAEALKAELDRVRAARRSREYSQISEFSPLAPMLPLRARREEEYKEREQQIVAELAAELSAMPAVTVDAGAGMNSPGEISFSQGQITEVSVTQAVDISV